MNLLQVGYRFNREAEMATDSVLIILAVIGVMFISTVVIIAFLTIRNRLLKSFLEVNNLRKDELHRNNNTL
jgi:hypothetical protein